jgi:hypothetical protein
MLTKNAVLFLARSTRAFIMQEESMSAKGSSQQITREYFGSLLVEMRTIDSTEAFTKTILFGVELSTPIMVAALSHLHEVRPNGMVSFYHIQFHCVLNL